jgi:hypothetical protein
MRSRPPQPAPPSSRLLLVLATALATLANRPAGDPQVKTATLWDLMFSAQLVVLADVEAVTDCALWRGLNPPAVCRGKSDHLVAEMKIREIWKLDERWVRSNAKLVPVRFEEAVASPAPPNYEQGDLVVAFLRQTGPQQQAASVWPEWETVPVWPGALFPAPSEVDGYRAVLVDALRLQSDWLSPRPAPDDWLAFAESRLGPIDTRR